MPITITRGNAIPNCFNANKSQILAARGAIALLQYADLWQGAGTLRSSSGMRVDMQGVIQTVPPKHNIQVQVNGIKSNSTVAHANVSESMMVNDPVNQRGVLHKVQHALRQSLNDSHSYEVAGAIP